MGVLSAGVTGVHTANDDDVRCVWRHDLGKVTFEKTV